MTLARQLTLIFSITFLVVFVGNFWNTLTHTRNFLHQQMVTNSQDLATSLGLLLRPYIIQNDEPGMQLLIDIYYDSGYYQKIYLEDMEGQPIIKREQELQVGGVPGWFVDMFPLDAAPAASLITAGWYQAGKLEVKRHPGYAYEVLWTHAKTDIVRMFFAYVLVIALMILVINYLLKPLRALEDQAVAIGEQHFKIQEDIPQTRELAQVVLAMNQMSWKLKGALEELTEYADSMRLEAFSDHLTGLNNLRRFEATIEKLLRSEESGLQGAIVKISINRFGEYCETNGYEHGERILKDLSAMLEITSEGFAGALPARIGSTEFGVLLPNSSKTEAASFGARLTDTIKPLTDKIEIRAGIACYSGGMRMGDVLGNADRALAQAESQEDIWALIEIEEGEKSHKEPQEWQDLLLDSLNEENIQLVLQPIRNSQQKDIMYHEVLARLRGKDGELISAGAVVPLAKRLGRIQDFEKAVVSKALQFLAQADPDVKIALNLSFQSIHEPQFLDWLFNRLEKANDRASRVVLEISEHEVELDMSTSKRIVQRAQAQGIRVAVEHFGVTFAGLSYLRELKPDFVKVDGSYVRGISKDADSRSFVHTLVRFAHGLDIRVIGECTENAADWNALTKLNVDGVQGYHVGQPRPIDSFVAGARQGETKPNMAESDTKTAEIADKEADENDEESNT